MHNDTWELTDLPRGCKALGCKWILKRKMKVDGSIDKYKARLVIQGFRQKEEIDFFDTYALVARISTIRLLLALAAIHDLVIHQMDVKTAFLNGDLDEKIYMKQPEGFVMLGHESKLEYSRAVGCLMYAMINTRPNITFAVRKLSRYNSNPSALHWQALGRVFQYLKGTVDYGLTYSGYPSVIEGYSDASWINNMEDHSSMSGWVFLLVGEGNEAEWLRNLVYEIPLWPKPISTISIRCDSAATLAKAYSQVYNANHLTKALARDLVRKAAIGMGLKST
uniref:Zinc finger, CCHC-type n=1 Tax=Tanacetum cinerariifolium TaxID=118510 RepID=A0A699IK98_TANCI|nr:zinc finger, CCHC-type [Tanacetum cinerariifolium]